MRAVDLHTHSTFSDGTKSPEELLKIAIEKNLAAIALTDHDTLDGIEFALKACDEINNSSELMSVDLLTGKKAAIELIPGVEVSTHWDKVEVHIVGLFVDHHNKEFLEFLRKQRDSRIERNIKVCENFTNIGIPISYETMLENYPDAVITRAHFADYLVKNGYVGDRNEAFDRYLNPGKPAYVKRNKVDPKEAIKYIHKAGGIAILAHPILYHLGNESLEKLISKLKEAGLDGIEALYSTYKAADERQIKELANKYDLLLSGGSDYHGDNKPHISLGTGMGKLFIPEEILDKLKAYRLSTKNHWLLFIIVSKSFRRGEGFENA